jgi:hypothetical protein
MESLALVQEFVPMGAKFKNSAVRTLIDRSAPADPRSTPHTPLPGASFRGHSAMTEDKKFGRPHSAKEKNIRKALKQVDLGMRKIAVEFGVGTGTVQRIAQEMRS